MSTRCPTNIKPVNKEGSWHNSLKLIPIFWTFLDANLIFIIETIKKQKTIFVISIHSGVRRGGSLVRDIIISTINIAMGVCLPSFATYGCELMI